jgi:hypothetical protein
MRQGYYGNACLRMGETLRVPPYMNPGTTTWDAPIAPASPDCFRDNDRRTDVVVCFITSIPRSGADCGSW